MSNWSSVLVLFSGIDGKAVPVGERSYGAARASLIAKYTDDDCGAVRNYHISPGGPSEGSLGSAYQVVLLMHVNHFYAERLIPWLRTLEWDLPEQVELLWKDENDDQYRCWRMVDAQPVR